MITDFRDRNLSLIAAFTVFVCAYVSSAYSQLPAGFENLRLNEIQVIGSHNSFKAAIDPVLFEAMSRVVPASRELNYAHPPLTDQLNLGLLNLELDIYHDPNGGLFAEPLGLAMVRESGKSPQPYDPQGEMRKPGFKVLHVPDIDFRSNCLTLSHALRELREWSEANSNHLPVVITVNLSDTPIPLPGSVNPIRFDEAALEALDSQLLRELGAMKLIIPDQVRGDKEDLESAILQDGWPKITELTGRFMFVLDDFGRKRDLYVSDHPGLRNRVLFVNSSPGNPYAAVMIRNNALIESEAITDLVNSGYLVRTRADSGTHEAKSGDYSRFEAAKKSGAQIISTDFYLADWRLNPGYRVRFEKGKCFRVNPVTGDR